ncbi:MAG: DNA polymerase III subunit beta [Patescibacteria group bacterium]|nr:DNA polymerase III subunit beta [Patescibacteria group bacterium]MDE2015145.1 DNA polymerase III subunit beta [Patescibacteria group bacterium]MDE2226573.1 DNA polymerase III subunit beta [Patescibacteria group bacterium]
MKFIVIKDNLKKGVFVVERINNENLNLPILKNILLETDGNKIKITSTDLEIASSFSVLGKVIENGRFTVPVNLLSNIVNNLESDRLNIENKNNKLIIKTDNYEAVIQGAPAEDFPITPKIKNQKEFIEIKAEIIKNSLNQVLIASQFSELRLELNSVLFDFSIDEIKLAATDSFRLAEKTINKDEFKTNYEQKFKVLIPLKTAKELQKTLNGEEIIKIYHDDNQILFKTEQLELLSRLIEGNFPEYKAIIPKKFNTEIILNKQEFINALKLTSVFGSRNNEVKIKSQENKKTIEVNSADQSIGENNYLLSGKIQGNLKETIFNWRYLSEALKILNSEEVFFGINSENEPAQLKSLGDDSYIYIVKPIAGD